MKICVVTDEYAGPNAMEGCGPGMRGLCELFANNGDEVTLLLSDFAATSDAPALSNLRVVRLSAVAGADSAMTLPSNAAAKAYSVYRFLTAGDFDVVHFVDRGGLGFYAALASAQGGLRAQVVTHVFSPSRWRRSIELFLPDLEALETETLERVQFENSGLAIVSDGSMLDRVADLGWSAPAIEVVERRAPSRAGLDPSQPRQTRALPAGQLEELIFVGAQTRSDGFDRFLEIAGDLRDLGLKLFVLGRFDRIEGEFSGSRFLRKLGDYSGGVQFLDGLDYEQALQWLSNRERSLCVLPAPDRMGSAGLAACFIAGAPFIASDVGGARAVVDPASHSYALAPSIVADIASAIRHIHQMGQPSVVAARSSQSVDVRWNELRAKMRPAGSTPLATSPLVSVCIAHHDRPEMLERALEHLMRQTYGNVEIIVVDDGSLHAATHARLDEIEKRTHRFPLRILRSSNRYLGAARNLAASHARGEYLLFHDDDNFAEPHEIETFVVAALRTNCEILTCQFWVARDDDPNSGSRKIEAFFLGVGSVVSLLENRFGDANALVRRETFERLGGFSELMHVGLEDWEFFLRAHLNGVRMAIVPDALFHYRVSATGMLTSGDILQNKERIFAAIDLSRPPLDPDLARLAAKPLVEAEIRSRLLQLFKHLPGGAFHTELLDVDPNGPATAAKLADLMSELAIDGHAGGQGVAKRAKIAKTPQDAPALLLRGWCFLPSGTAHVPEIWLIDGEAFETFALAPEPREDVNTAFGLGADASVGFHAYLRPLRRAPSVRRGRRIETSEPRKIATLDKGGEGMRAHIDIASAYRLAPIAPPQETWTGALSVFTDIAAFSVILNGDRLLKAAPSTNSHRRRMIVEKPLRDAKAIVPAQGEGWIQFD